MTRDLLGHKQADDHFRMNTQNSVFTPDGRLRQDALSFTSQGRVMVQEHLHLAGITWAPAPYDAEHCQWLARLTEYMTTLDEKHGGLVGGPLPEREQKVLHAVAMLYCIGFKGGDDTGYAMRSAAEAERFFKDGGGFGSKHWSQPDVQADVCRLIYAHNDPREIASDKRLMLFEDARRYENARLFPNTAEGLKILKSECRPELFHLGWSKDRANFRAWMLKRGWR